MEPQIIPYIATLIVSIAVLLYSFTKYLVVRNAGRDASERNSIIANFVTTTVGPFLDKTATSWMKAEEAARDAHLPGPTENFIRDQVHRTAVDLEPRIREWIDAAVKATATTPPRH